MRRSAETSENPQKHPESPCGVAAEWRRIGGRTAVSTDELKRLRAHRFALTGQERILREEHSAKGHRVVGEEVWTPILDELRRLDEAFPSLVPAFRLQLIDGLAGRCYATSGLLGHLASVLGKIAAELEVTAVNDRVVAGGIETPAITKGDVFIAMPMIETDPALDDVHEAIKAVFRELALHAERVDDPSSGERITDRVIASIRSSEDVVVDLTHNRPNVYFEAGYAHALGKLPVYIARKGTSIEFDLKDYPVMFFRNMRELREGLKKRLAAPAGSGRGGADASQPTSSRQQQERAPSLSDPARELLLEATQQGHDGTVMRVQTWARGCTSGRTDGTS
jgi:hypothetical protein